MSSITLSSATRQNLLVAQDTASLLSTTQNRLATGKKVNSALDSPSSFFTAQGLDNRAGDLSNILDSISNGVQVIQAANTGITSLQKLVDNAKSVANQALQATIGYSTKSNVSTTISGATAADLRGTTAYTNAQASSNVLFSGATGGTGAVTSSTKLGGTAGTITTAALVANKAGTTAAVTTAAINTTVGATLLSATGPGPGVTAGESITVNGKTLNFVASGAASADASGNYTIGIDQNLSSVAALFDKMTGSNTGTASSFDDTNHKFVINTGTNVDVTLGGASATLTKLGLTAATTSRTGTTALTGSTVLYDTFSGGTGLTDSGKPPFQDGDTLNVNGKTITFKKADVPTTAPTGTQKAGNNILDGSGNVTVYMGANSTATATVDDVLHAVDLASGVAYINSGTVTANAGQSLSVVNGGKVVLNSSTGADLNVSGKADILKSLGLTSAVGSGTTSVTAARSTSSVTAANLIQDGSTLNVNGKTITFKNAATPAAANVPTGSGVTGNLVTDGSGNSTVYLQNGSVSDILNAIDLATGAQTTTIASGSATAPTPASGSSASSVSNGVLKISTGTLADLNITGSGNALTALGLGGNTGTGSSFTASRTSSPGGLAGKTLTFGSLNNGTAVNVTFGDGTNGTVKSLDDLNAKLALNNMQASLDASGKLTISTANDYASSTIGSTDDGGAIGGTAAALFSAAQAPVADVNSQNTRKNLLSQFNQILDNIKTTAQDASFNGVNLLNGDTLKLTFNEKGSSTMNLIGVTFDPSGLGLTKLGQNGLNEFEDISSTNKVISSLTQASTALRSQASTFGSNLSVVQNRQDFNKQIINVLQTGSSKLTDADLNEEAANSQALSTRQSLTVSALSLANQAQQSVLQLLR